MARRSARAQPVWLRRPAKAQPVRQALRAWVQRLQGRESLVSPALGLEASVRPPSERRAWAVLAAWQALRAWELQQLVGRLAVSEQQPAQQPLVLELAGRQRRAAWAWAPERRHVVVAEALRWAGRRAWVLWARQPPMRERLRLWAAPAC